MPSIVLRIWDASVDFEEQDYHRFHSPVDAIVGEVKDIAGQLYSEHVRSGSDIGSLNSELVNVFQL